MKSAKIWLHSFLEKLTPRTKKMIMVGCYLFMGAYAIGLIIGAISNDLPEQQKIIRPLVQKNMERATAHEVKLNIAKFKTYMDSLGRTPEGKRQRDSIIINHPGLMDTIARLEKLINH